MRIFYLIFFSNACIDYPTETYREYLEESNQSEWTTSNQYFDDIDSILYEEIFTYENYKANPKFFEKLEELGYKDADNVIEFLYKYKKELE